MSEWKPPADAKPVEGWKPPQDAVVVDPKPQASTPMTTPLPGAAAGPATSSVTPAAPSPTSSQAAVMQFDAALQQPMPADFSQRGTDPLASHPSTPEIPEKLDPLNQKRAELFRGYTSIRNKERAAREEHSTMLANQRNYRDMGMAGGADELNKKLGFASDQASMYGDIKKQHTDYFNEQLDRSVGEEVDKDVNSLTMDRQGLLVADPAKVREKAERFAAKYGLAKDQEFVKDVQNRMDSRVQAGVLKPRVDKLFDEEKKKIISEEGDKVWRGFTTDSVEYAHATETISDLQKQASAGAKADADAIYARTSAAAEAITEQWKSQEAETLKAADAVKAQFDAGKLDASTANQLLDRVNQKYQSGYAQYSGAVKAEQDAYITDLNKVNSRYNERFAEQQKAILKDANARVQEAAAKYLKEYEGSPEAEATRQKLNAAYEKAWKTAAQERGKAEGVAANVRYNLASSALGPIAAMGGRFMESTVAGLGGVFKGMATTVGSDGGYVLGQEMERAFLLPEARSKEFADLIDPANISQLSGQLVGGMAPSIVAAAGVSAATGGSGAPIAAQLVASSLAAWGAETLDISGRMKDDVFRDTRDMDKANDAAWKSFRSQVQLLPTYAFEGLPFVKGFLKAVPTRALRAGTGAAIEYGTGVLQEVPQNIAEKNIRAGKDPWEGFTEELDRQSKSGELRSTLIGMAPITLLGGAGQITESSGKQDMLNAAKSYAAKAKIDQISASGGQQWMNGMVKARGEKFARAVISSMYTGGSIDEATAKKFIGFVDENRAINSEAKALNIPGVHHDAYVAFSADYADLSAKAEAETSPLAKAVLTQRANEAKKAATEIAAGNGEYVTVKYPDGTTTVLAPSQAAKLFADEEFLSTAAITSFGNNGLTFTANGKEAMTMLGDFQERSMERLEEIKQGKREFLADAKADREAKAPKAAPVTTAAPSLPASPSINITPPPTTTGGATAPTATASEPTAKKEQKPTASKALEAVGLTEIPEAAPTSDEEGGGAVTPEAATGFQEAVDASKQSRSPNEVSEWVLTNSRVGDTYTDNIGNGYEVVRVKTRKDGKREVELQQFEILPDGTKDVNNAGVLLLVDGLPNRASNLLGYSYIDKDGNRQTSDYKLTRNEGSTTTSQASAAAPAEDTGAAPGVPLEQPTAAEPVANSIDRHETRNKQYIVERGEDGQVRVTQAPGYKPRPLPPMPDADAPSAVIRQWKREKNKVDDAERQARRTALIEYEKEYGVDTGRGHKTPIQKWNESVADVNRRMNKMSDQNKDPRLYALSFLLNGGKINFAAAKKELGSNARTDLDKLKKNGILVDDPNAKSVQGVADALAESMAEQLGTDVGTAAELRTALIDALGHNSRSGVLKAMTDILDKMPKVKDVASGDAISAMTPEDWDDVNAVEEARSAFIEYVQKTGGDVDLANAWFDDEVGKNRRSSFDHETPERQQQLIETAEQALSQLPPDGTEAETGTPDAAPGEVDAGADVGGVGEAPGRQSDEEEQRLAAEAKRARAERDRFVADWNERGQGLFAPEEGMAQQTIDGGFDNSQENFDARVEPLNERVRQADKALADYVNSAASRAQAAAQQTSIDQAAADNIPVSKPEKAMSSASRFRPRKRVEFDTPIKGPSGAVLKAYEWQYEFEEYIDDRGEERVRRVSDWNKAELSDETGRDIVHQFEVVTPDGLGYLVSAESALKLMGYMEANASVKSKMSAAKALAGLLMQRQVLQEEVARRKAVEDEVDALKRPEITEEDKSENEELRGFGREESKNRINQIWRMGDASIWASFKKDDPFLNSEKEERTKTLVRSWKDNRLKERGVKSYENPSAKLREVEKKIATKERQLGAKATDVTQAPAQAEAPLPKKEETTYEAKARKAAAILERAKLKPDQLYALPLPPSVWNGAIRAMQEVIIAGGKAVDAIAAAIKHIQASDWWKNKATQNEKDEVMSHLQGRISDLETALAAEDVASLKENIQQAKATGAQNTRTKQQDARKEFVQTVKDALKPLHGRMTPSQVKFITAAAAKVNPTSPKSVSRFERVAAKAMAKANYADDLSKAKQAQKRAKKLAKQADVALNHREALKAIAKVDVGMLNDPAEFTGPVLDYLQQFGAIGKNYQPGSSEAIIDAMGKLQEQTMAEYRNMLLEEFGVEAGSVDPQQLYDALESDDFDAFAKNLEESKRKEVADAIRQVADYSKMGLESYENEDLSATEKKTLETLRGIDIDLLSTDQQKDYIKTADNITLNDAFYGAGRMEAVAKATEGLAAAQKAVKSTPLRKVWTTPLKEMYQQQFASVSGMFRFLFGQGEGMAKFHDAIGMTDLILGKKKVDDAVSNAGEKMADFYTGLRKKYKDADTDTMRAAEGIAAYVLQPIPNVGLEESFALRKQQVADSIAAKSERTKRQDEAGVEQRAFDLVLNEATTRDELIRAMKAKAPSAWASVEFLANEVLAPHSKEVLEHRENFWNEAVDVDNPMYLPISYRFLTSAQIAEDAPGQFGAAEKLRKPKESANLIKRESVKTLPKDRVIDMNIRRNTLNALERNLYDTYTSPAWQRMREFFRLPATSKVVGGLDNSDFMQSRLNDLRSAQMREGPKADNLERAVSAITNTVRKAASQIALGGFTQAIKQPADQLTSAMVNVGPEWVGKSIMEVNKAEPLLQLTSIGDRGELIGGTNWDNTLEAETAAMARALKGNKMERFEAATESYRRFLMAALTKSDVLSARTAWLAYYQKYLADKGIEVSDWQQEADMVKEGDPVRRQALAFAEVNADITQGSSDPTKQAKLGQRSPQAWANLLKAAFNPFSSFTIGMRERIINDASDLMFYGGKQMYDADGKRTKEGDRAATAGRSLAATLASNIMFTVAKVYIAKSLIALGAEGIRAAFAAAAGDDDDDKQKGMAMMSLMMNILYTMRLMDADVYRMFSTAYRDEKKESKMSEGKKLDAEQEKALRNAKNAYTSIMQSMLVSGFSPFAENALVDGVNWGSYMMQGAMGELPTTKSTGAPMKYDYWVKQPEYPPLYRYGQGYHESNYGVFSVILDRASELQEQAKDAAGFGKASGPTVESPEDAKKRIEAMSAAYK